MRQPKLTYVGFRAPGLQFFRDDSGAERRDYGVKIGFRDATGDGTGLTLLPEFQIDSLRREVGGDEALYSQQIDTIGEWDALFLNWPYFYEFDGARHYGGCMQSLLVAKRVSGKVAIIEQIIGYSGMYDEKYREELILRLRKFSVRDAALDPEG